MELNNAAELKRQVDLKPGIFLARYVVAEETSSHPAVKISIEDKSKDDVFLVLHDDEPGHDVTLWRPGTGVTLKALRPGSISIEVIPIQADASTNATVKIDPIIQGENNSIVLGQAPGKASRSLNLTSFKLHGHVAGRGDLEVPANEWLAGPSVPARIEGIAIDWPGKPQNLDLRYNAIGPRSNAAATPMVRVGNFAGTRGRALPLLGVNLELAGSGASAVQLVAEALFLGSPIIRATGARVVLSGPSGLEPLIGFKLGLELKQQEDTGEKPEMPKILAEPALPRPVRVFRSKARSSTA